MTTLGLDHLDSYEMSGDDGLQIPGIDNFYNANKQQTSVFNPNISDSKDFLGGKGKFDTSL